MDEQQDTSRKDSPLRRLWQRLRAGDTVRPTWRHFAPHMAFTVGLVPLMFFFVTIRRLGEEGGGLAILAVVSSLWVYSLFLFPAFILQFSLLHATWKLLRSRSLRGLIWFVRPLLLFSCLWIASSPLQRAGMVWDFRRNLAERVRAVQYILGSMDLAAMRNNDRINIPDDILKTHEHVYVSEDSQSRQIYIYFYSPSATYRYYIDHAPPTVFDEDVRYDDHWYLVQGGLK